MMRIKVVPKLRLQSNGISDELATRAAPLLAFAGVGELFLGKNLIGDDGAAAFARAYAACA